MAGPVVGESLYTEKLITLFAMAAITFLCGMLPLKLFTQLRHNSNPASRSWWKAFISLSSCFSGGVFIAACLLDLLPDVEEKILEVEKKIKTEYEIDIDFPLAQFIMCSGFFLILTVEQSVLSLQESWAISQDEREPLLPNGGGGAVSYQSTHQHPDDVDHTQADHGGQGHSHSHLSHTAFQQSSLRSIMLLLALSFHSVFEGVAIGLQENSGQLLSIFIAVIVHKAVMAFSLGLNIAQSSLTRRSFIISNVIFSLSSPIGVAFGIAMEDLPDSLSTDICNGVLQGIAGGTFLYITFFEVLPHEMNVPKKRPLKVFFVILGFASISGLLFITH